MDASSMQKDCVDEKKRVQKAKDRIVSDTLKTKARQLLKQSRANVHKKA